MELSLRYLRLDPIGMARVHGVAHLERIGSDYGGWIVPTSLLGPASICYCAGVGEDVSFDLGLIGRYGCHVYAFDPTPKAVRFVERTCSSEPRFHFEPLGLWDKEATVRFYEPQNPLHVSHSALNLQRTKGFFEAPCRRLSDIMRQNGHERLDLLKLDIEGAEYRVIDTVIDDGVDVGILCVEFDEAHHPLDRGFPGRIRRCLSRLRRAGYRIVAVEMKCNYTLVRNDLLDAARRC